MVYSLDNITVGPTVELFRSLLVPQIMLTNLCRDSAKSKTKIVKTPNMKLRLNYSIKVRFGLENPTDIQVLVGEGSERNEFVINNENLVSWLFKFIEDTEQIDLVENCAEELGMEIKEAEKLIEKLIELEIFVRSSSIDMVPTSAELLWEKWGWRDALDLYTANRNLLWIHDYTNNPRVMTWYHKDILILPETPEPSPDKSDKPWPKKYSLPLLSDKIRNQVFGEVLHNRRTRRNFKNRTISLQDFSDLLYLSFQNIGTYRDKPYKLFHSYSLKRQFEIYPVILNVEGIENGIYYYNYDEHSLYLINQELDNDILIKLTNDQLFLKNSAVGIFYTINWSQFMWKYRYARSYQIALMEFSGIIQTVLLNATALNLKTFLTPAIRDTKVMELLEIPDGLVECPLYITGIGI